MNSYAYAENPTTSIDPLGLAKFMSYIRSEDLTRSIDFYKLLGFFIYSDDADGDGNRQVSIAHPASKEAIYKLKFISAFKNEIQEKATVDNIKNVTFSIVTMEYYEWINCIKSSSIDTELEVIEPWGIWIYFRDPNGNLLCVTNSEIW